MGFGKKNSSVKTCPRKQGTIWIGVKTSGPFGTGGKPISGASVALTGPTPGNGSTDASGYAKFPARNAGAYTFKVALPGKPNHVLEPYSSSLGVTPGEVAIGRATAYPTGTLIVRVVDDLGKRVEADTLVNNAYLSETLKELHKAADLYRKVPAGRCRVHAFAIRRDVYGDPSDDVEVDVPEGGTVRAQIVLPVVNTVMPQVDLANNEIWFVAADPPSAAAGPPPNPAPPPTVRSGHTEPSFTVRLGFVETRADKPYTAGGTLSYDAASIELFPTQACTGAPVASGTTYTNAELKQGVTLYAKGKSSGVANLKLALAPSNNASIIVKPPLEKPLAVREINVVEPKVRVEHKVVLFDRKLARYQKDEDKKAASPQDAAAVKFVPSPTFVELSAEQRNDHPAYTKTATLELTPANAEAFSDEAFKNKFNLSKPIPIEQLTGAQPLKLYLKGKSKGKFSAKLKLAASGDPHVIVEHPAEVKMGVVEIEMTLHHHDLKAIAKLKADPDDATWPANLEALVLPDQKAMTDEEKVKAGRLLHLQSGTTNFGRAKLVIKKLVDAQWPDGVDDYRIVLDQNSTDGELKVFDAEVDGNEVVLPKQVKVSDLKVAGDPAIAHSTFWVEGSVRTTDKDKMLGARLDLGVDRVGPGPGGAGLAEHVALADKAAKRNGDGARFTIVEITPIEIHYKPEKGKAEAWDAAQNRFYINLKKDPAGRAVKVRATLAPPIKGVTLHLMLAPDKDNRKTANWGVDLPATWKWHEVSPGVKHKDRKVRDAFLSYPAETNAKGQAEKNLVLSRFGGDKFWLAAHLEHDPHLAKYVDGHANLGKRVPARSTNAVEVWRTFWYQEVKVAGMPAFPAFGPAEGQYDRVKALMTAGTPLSIPKATVAKFKPQAIYPRYMIEVNGGNADALVVSEPNKHQFFKTFKKQGDKPNMIPILVCDGQWDPMGNSQAKSPPAQTADTFPMQVNMSGGSVKQVLDPPLQGGKLFVYGTWTAAEWDPTLNANAGDWANVRTGNIAGASVTIDPARNHLAKVSVALPAGINASPNTTVWIEDLIVQGAKLYLGESFQQRILAVYDPTEPVDFQNTIAHEVGHAYQQVIRGDPAGGVAGVPAHPNQADMGQGNHCRNLVDKCVMYDSGPVVGSLNRYCDVCHPYLLVQDMTKIT